MQTLLKAKGRPHADLHSFRYPLIIQIYTSSHKQKTPRMWGFNSNRKKLFLELVTTIHDQLS